MYQETYNEKIQIIPWEERFSQDFIELSVEWLVKYVRVEPADEALLYHPHETILDKGGMIFFANDGVKNVGTVTMLKLEDGIYELAKLAVTETCKGRHIGDKLIQAALGFAKENHAKKVILFTNSRLGPAIHLYHKYGFIDVPLVDNEYEESDMKMALSIGNVDEETIRKYIREQEEESEQESRTLK